MTPRVAVIIPAHNAAATLGGQLEALARQIDAPPFDVVVVDNRSLDGTHDVARQHGATVVLAAERAGVHYARNTGVRETDHDLILHCDADDIVADRWVAELVSALDRHDIVGGHVSLDVVNPLDVALSLPSPTRDGLPMCMNHAYAIGANIGYRRALWEKLCGFDETFTGGHEEVDFCWRAQSLGASIGFAPAAIIYYRQRGDLRSLRQRFHYGQSFAYLYSKHQGEEIPRVSARMEARKIVLHLADARHLLFRRERRRPWIMHTAWVAGRLRGDLKFGVRAPG